MQNKCVEYYQKVTQMVKMSKLRYHMLSGTVWNKHTFCLPCRVRGVAVSCSFHRESWRQKTRVSAVRAWPNPWVAAGGSRVHAKFFRTRLGLFWLLCCGQAQDTAGGREIPRPHLLRHFTTSSPSSSRRIRMRGSLDNQCVLLTHCWAVHNLGVGMKKSEICFHPSLWEEGYKTSHT